MTDKHVPYRILLVAANRFAITLEPNIDNLGHNAIAVVGYVLHNSDDTWSVERDGRLLGSAYASLPDAVEALVATDRALHPEPTATTWTEL